MISNSTSMAAKGQSFKIGYLISKSGLLGVDPVQCTVGYHTVETLVVDTGGHHNQLTICLCKAAWKYTINPEICEKPISVTVQFHKKKKISVTYATCIVQVCRHTQVGVW